MARVTLHSYSEEARSLIESRAYDDAIAICRDILKRFPKHVETYRILGEACLEKGELDEATDIFKRLLSADPENFVAYAGLGVIHEQNQELAQAIWHMERAFELAPNNEEIRNALRRLYCQRDGTEPVRIKLNKVALARLYARGGQFRQAIEEFGRSLQLEPGRLDIQLSLTETLWRDERREQATELAREILKACPDCLKAILLLGAIQIEKGRTEEGKEILARARALDPENRMAQALFGDRSPLPLQTVMIPRTAERMCPPLPAGVSAAEGTPPIEEAVGAVSTIDAESPPVDETPIAAIPEEPVVEPPPGAVEPAPTSEPEEPAEPLFAEPPVAQLTAEQAEAASTFEPTPVPQEDTSVAAAPEDAEAGPPAVPAVSAGIAGFGVFPVQTTELAVEVAPAVTAGLPEEQTEQPVSPGPEPYLREAEEVAAPDVTALSRQEVSATAPENASVQGVEQEVARTVHLQGTTPVQEAPALMRPDEGREPIAVPPAAEAEALAQTMAPGPIAETAVEAAVPLQVEEQVELTVPPAEGMPMPEPEVVPSAHAEPPAIPSQEGVAEIVAPDVTVAPGHEPEMEVSAVEAPLASAAARANEVVQAAVPEPQPAPAEQTPSERPAEQASATPALPVTDQAAVHPELRPHPPEQPTKTTAWEPGAETPTRPAPEASVVAERVASTFEGAPRGVPPVDEALAARPSLDIERYRQQLKQNPKDDLTRLSLARIYRDQEQVELALEQYRVLERAKPEILSEVVVDMEGIVASRPGNLTAHELLGDLYTKNGLLRKALERYRWLLVQYDQKPA